ncbi:MAG: glycosyltransferase family 39 protein [Calditrichia bacterium]
MENYGKYLLGGLFAITIFTRFLRSAPTVLWLDEGLSIRLAARPFDQIFAAAAPVDHNPPLFLYLLHFWLNIFGTGEIAARSFSALCSIATFPLIWLLAYRLFDKKIALPCSFSQSAPVSGVLRTGTVTHCSICCRWLPFFVFWNGCEPNRQIWQIALLAVNVLLVYSHIFGWFIVNCSKICGGSITYKKAGTFTPQLVNFTGINRTCFSAVCAAFNAIQIQKGYWVTHRKSSIF